MSESFPYHFVIDCETLGTAPESRILSIACVAFREGERQSWASTFYSELCTKTQLGRTVSVDTLNWWADQGGVASKLELSNSSLRLVDELPRLSDFIHQFSSEASTFWAQGSDFDFPLLVDAYTCHALQVPWKYHKVRDLRTLLKLLDYTPEIVNENPHNALADALYEYRVLDALCFAKGLRIR